MKIEPEGDSCAAHDNHNHQKDCTKDRRNAPQEMASGFLHEVRRGAKHVAARSSPNKLLFMLGRIPAGGVPGEDECAKLLQRAQARLRRNERRRPLLLDARWFSVRSSYDFHATLEHVELFNHRRVPESIRNMPPR